jgi:hypothetical protein
VGVDELVETIEHRSGLAEDVERERSVRDRSRGRGDDGDARISRDGAEVETVVVTAREDLEIARAVATVRG